MTVLIEHHGPITSVAIDRVHRRNAVDRDTARALADAFRAFDADNNATVAILTGAGGTFCAGADLQAIAEGRPNRVAPDGDGPMGPTRMRISKPVIAAIEGHAVAGGLELALWCDLRVMADNAVLGVFCRRFGVPLIDGGTVRLPRLIGRARALDLVLTGRPVHAEEALSIGLATRVVPAGSAFTEALSLARQISAFPQLCLRHDRLSLLEQEDLDYDAAIANELTHGMVPLTHESVAGATRFKQGQGRHGGFSADVPAHAPDDTPDTRSAPVPHPE